MSLLLDESAPLIVVASEYLREAFVGSLGEVVELVEAQRGGSYRPPTITVVDPPLNVTLPLTRRPETALVQRGIGFRAPLRVCALACRSDGYVVTFPHAQTWWATPA